MTISMHFLCKEGSQDGFTTQRWGKHTDSHKGSMVHGGQRIQGNSNLRQCLNFFIDKTRMTTTEKNKTKLIRDEGTWLVHGRHETLDSGSWVQSPCWAQSLVKKLIIIFKKLIRDVGQSTKSALPPSSQSCKHLQSRRRR